MCSATPVSFEVPVLWRRKEVDCKTFVEYVSSAVQVVGDDASEVVC